MESKSQEKAQINRPGVLYFVSAFLMIAFIAACMIYSAYYSKEMYGLSYQWKYGHDLFESFLNIGFVLSVFVHFYSLLKLRKGKP